MILRICLDPGHGGADPGAVGPTGLEEASVVLDICKRTKAILESEGHLVWLTRTNDTHVDLSDRVELSRKERCDAFISVHCNAGPQEAHGVETIFGTIKSRDLAYAVQGSVVENIHGHRNRGVKLSPSPGYARKIYVIRNAGCASCLVEAEFISNSDMEKLFLDSAFKENIANGIASGIIKSFQPKPDLLA